MNSLVTIEITNVGETLITFATFILLVSRMSVGMKLEVRLLVEPFLTDLTPELNNILVIPLHMVSQLALPIKFQPTIGKLTGKGMTFALMFWKSKIIK